MTGRMGVHLVRQQTASGHAAAESFAPYLQRMAVSPYAQRCLLAARRRFIERYPDLEEWFAAPLALRIGRLGRRPAGAIVTDLRSYQARPYLLFLALSGYAKLDWEWLLAIGQLTDLKRAAVAGLDLGFDVLVDDAVRLGFARETAESFVGWVAGRIALHRGGARVEYITAADVDELVEAMQTFARRPDVATLFGSAETYQQRLQVHLRYVRQVRIVLYHRGQVDREPDPVRWRQAPAPIGPTRMYQVAERFLAARRLTDRPSTLENLRWTMRRFITFSAETAPTIASFAEVEREHVLAFATMLEVEPTGRTGRPPNVATRSARLSALASFFRDTAAWGWEDVPGRPLLTPGDLPKRLHRMPRYIPADELERLMVAIRALPCPYQRTALLVARWSGARREEIRRLSLDCLDRYPDGTSRLRVPAGKTRTERVIPLHEEAAAAIRSLQAQRGVERGLSDEQTGMPTRYLFVRRGGLFSLQYLFNIPLRSACASAGLVTSQGVPTVSAHRFRHTVGTQLAERGAKLHTIMQVLGHTSANMAMVYAHISDREVLRDYQAVLGPGATIAGPYAETLRLGGLSADEREWLKTNFFKTELELGHCLRLPQEGPCECELYLTCAKFVTTTEYIPRLRSRHQRELQLIEDAERHGWEREVERHHSTVLRIEQLLTELGSPVGTPAPADGCAAPDRGKANLGEPTGS
jgi:integrase